MKLNFKLILGVFLVLFLSSCGKRSNDETGGIDVSEVSQQVGDSVASVDEFGVTGGTIANWSWAEKTFARLQQHAPISYAQKQKNIWDLILSPSVAASCTTVSYGACSSNSRVRNFGNCTIGSVSVSGDVTLTWGGGAVNCALGSNGHHISRVPDFEISGRLGARLLVQSVGSTGQRITNQGGNTLSFQNTGIRRQFVDSTGAPFVDFTTTTGSSLVITGQPRSGRTIDSGTLVVLNNLTNVSCTYTASSLSKVTWGNGTCNCPTAGEWGVVCRDSNNNTLYSFSLVHSASSCGAATVSGDGTQTSVNFDRCGT